MSDHRTKSGGNDRTRINVDESYELRDWSTKFKVTPEELRAAVDKVGTAAKEVEAYLHKRHAYSSH